MSERLLLRNLSVYYKGFITEYCQSVEGRVILKSLIYNNFTYLAPCSALINYRTTRRRDDVLEEYVSICLAPSEYVGSIAGKLIRC